MGLFHIVLEKKSQEISLTIIESQSLSNLHNLDSDSQIPHFEWTLHNDRRKIHIGNRSATKKTEIKEYRRNGNQWKNNQSLQLQREEFDKLLDILPSLLGYVETYKKSCDNEIMKQEFTSNTKRKTYFFVPVLSWSRHKF